MDPYGLEIIGPGKQALEDSLNSHPAGRQMLHDINELSDQTRTDVYADNRDNPQGSYVGQDTKDGKEVVLINIDPDQHEGIIYSTGDGPQDYEVGMPNDEVIFHECVHVRQKLSYPGGILDDTELRRWERELKRLKENPTAPYDYFIKRRIAELTDLIERWDNPEEKEAVEETNDAFGRQHRCRARSRYNVTPEQVQDKVKRDRIREREQLRQRFRDAGFKEEQIDELAPPVHPELPPKRPNNLPDGPGLQAQPNSRPSVIVE